MKAHVYKAVLYTVALAVGYLLGLGLFHDSPNRLTLAGVMAWWFGLYVGYLCAVKSTALPYFLAIALGVSLVDYLFSLGVLAQDSASNLVGHIYLTVVAAAIFGSPIVINRVVEWVVGLLKKRQAL